MKKNLLALFFGCLFGLGLSFSKMTDPQVVLDFFDIFGNFNPLLFWVFASALLVTLLGYYWVFKLKKPLFEKQFSPSKNRIIDKKLIVGACLFGMGWGISGYCPGPGLGVAYINTVEFFVFIIPLLLAIGLVKYFNKPSNP